MIVNCSRFKPKLKILFIMRKITSLLFASLFILTACTGPQGPPGFDGFDGLDGQDGGIIVADAFEIEIDFNADNNFEFVEPYGFDVFPSDITLVFIEWDVEDGETIWRLLPQNVFFDDGSILVYNFDFTQQDVRFFLDGTTDFNTLDDVWTQNQAFRVVVVPADNVDGIDVSNLETLINLGNIESFDIR